MRKVVVATACIAFAMPAIAVAAVEKDNEAQSHIGYTSEYSKTWTYKR